MPIERLRLDWSRPCLPEAAAWLVREFAADGECDLTGVWCVLPSRRAGRVLPVLMLEAAASRGLRFVPPRCVTPGDVGELLPPPEMRVATTVECRLAWLQTLRAMDAAALEALLRERPHDDDLHAWTSLAERCHAMETELAGERVCFDDAATAARDLGMDGEGDRWSVLARAQRLQRDALDRLSLADPTSALEARLAAGPPAHVERVVLIAATELNAMQRRVIETFADRTVAMVHADEARFEDFDEIGCLAWQRAGDRRIEIDDERLVVADRPTDQAQVVMRQISRWSSVYASDDVSIGLADPEIAPAVVRAGAWAGVTVRDAQGASLRRTPPWRLLERVRDWILDRRFADLAALVRHTDAARAIQAYAGEYDSWVALLDEYGTEHLPSRFGGAWPTADDDKNRVTRVRRLVDAVDALVEPISGEPRSLGKWVRGVLDLLRRVYAPDEAPPTLASQTADALEAIARALRDIATSEPSLAPDLEAHEVLPLLLSQIDDIGLPEEARATQVEMLGWLEMHLDPAPALVIAGLNDGRVPETGVADAFLPDGLRRALGLMHDHRRQVRDAYLVEAITRSRPEVTIVIGRRSALDDPLLPSRLLLMTEPDRIVERIARFASSESIMAAPEPIGIAPAAERTGFGLPDLPELATPEAMSVTSFRTYLTCPYRYALGHLLYLKKAEEEQPEMNALVFGNFVHAVLERFGGDEATRDLDDAREIAACLRSQLETLADEWFGGDTAPVVRVQLERAARRLDGFAFTQARWRRSGWRIVGTEYALHDHGVTLDVPGGDPMPIRGVIDRIDRNDDGRWAVLDYKTGESAGDPHAAHHDPAKPDTPVGEIEWKDLQLPLYRHLVTQVGLPIDGEILVGYVALPKSGRASFEIAQWSPHHHDDAMRVARDIVTDVRSGAFDINLDYHSSWDRYARICRAGSFGLVGGGAE